MLRRVHARRTDIFEAVDKSDVIVFLRVEGPFPRELVRASNPYVGFLFRCYSDPDYGRIDWFYRIDGMSRGSNASRWP